MGWLPVVFLAWPASVGLLWFSLFPPTDASEGLNCRPTTLHRFLLGVPPTLLLIPFLLLLLVSPTAQFNAGWELGMRLWSFWITAWEPFWRTSQVLSLAYLVATVALACCVKTRPLAWPALFASASSGIAWIILSHAFPTA